MRKLIFDVDKPVGSVMIDLREELGILCNYKYTTSLSFFTEAAYNKKIKDLEKLSSDPKMILIIINDRSEHPQSNYFIRCSLILTTESQLGGLANAVFDIKEGRKLLEEYNRVTSSTICSFTPETIMYQELKQIRDKVEIFLKNN
jgi:hypothetical protein